MQASTFIFRLRHVRPTRSKWFSIRAADAAAAAQAFHFSELRGVYLPEGSLASGAWYSVVEVADHGEFVSRIFCTGIGRKGGMRSAHHAASLDDVARRLGVTHETLHGDWAGEDDEWTPLTARDASLRPSLAG